MLVREYPSLRDLLPCVVSGEGDTQQKLRGKDGFVDGGKCELQVVFGIRQSLHRAEGSLGLRLTRSLPSRGIQSCHEDTPQEENEQVG